MKRILFVIAIALLSVKAFAQQMQTYKFAEKNGQELFMDVYTPENVNESTVTVMYVFGGGFISGERNDASSKEYCLELVKHGYVAVAIDYRLGLKGEKDLGLFNHEPVERAINMATEDAISALSYLVENAKELRVNPQLIVLVGSSAGAITVLQTDYSLCNGFLNAGILPADFRLAGVASYAGAIFSTRGKVKYSNHEPAPTMFFHGTSDKLVTYKQLRLFSTGFFGSFKLAPRFQKFGYPYYFRRYEGYGHSVAGMFTPTIDDFDWFVNHFVINHELLQVEEDYVNMDETSKPSYDNFTPDDLYK